MSDLATDSPLQIVEGVARERGGFWRRVTAFAIDLAIATLLLQVLAFALYPATGGRVQFPGGFMLLTCDKLAAVPAGFEVPTDFVPTAISDCRQGLFQLTSARVLYLTKVTQNGGFTTTRQITYLRDAEGKPVAEPILGLFWLPLFFVLRLLFDRRGGTPGRRLLGLRLADAAHPPPSSAVLRRYLMQALPLAPYVAGPLLLSQFGVRITPLGEAWWMVMILPTMCGGIGALIALHHVIYRKEAFYDSFAQTSVLRIDGANAVVRSAAVLPLLPPPLPGVVPDQVEPALRDVSDQAEQAVADALDVAQASAAAPRPSMALPPPLPRRANYLVRHWRGELSLPVSYWVNGTALGAGLGVAIAVVGHLLNERGSEYLVLWLVSVIAIWASIVLLRIWVTVGVWRAASRYQARGKSFWGGAAKVVSALGMVYVAYSCAFVGAPQIAGVYEIVAGDARVGPHQFRVLADGRGLEFTGGITFGVARELETFLNAMGSLRTVQLNSIGGRMREAQKMSDLIKARGLTTYVTQSCLSACTVVFLGGKERVLLAKSGKLGFHQTSFRGMTALDRQVAIETEIVRLQGFGLSRAFAERVTATPPSGMWYPDQDELLREKVATRLYIPQSKKPAGGSAPAATATPQASATDGSATAAGGDRVFPTPGQPLQMESGTYQTGRAFIPAEVMKRLTAKPAAKTTTTEAQKN
ncbi:RDD family protein [Bradyrhizobium macuxiense]|uniref:RDD family protein n=1 Tax=Bradyrhizobium macuxiense TaxID=1755647 RepID=UPI00142EC174|nr:RDD family protein [Bradyrhizobium macuxiense]